ncbi:MAG: hypothetical protein COC01_02590 [Bacteroidetes bacterium]|nr:MAG: hypothetical protein COC01_02590 [Bacteroidota bacterium]
MKDNSIVLFFFLSFLFFACTQPSGSNNKKQVVILISKCKSDSSYRNWLKRFENNIRTVDIYSSSRDSLDHYLAMASGILISGGKDIAPDKYGKGDEVARCGKIDLRRDSIDLKMIMYGMEHKVPMLGICRGLQFMNVANKGTLIIDIPTDFDSMIQHRGNVEHWVKLEMGSQLYSMCLVDSSIVISNHHQGIDRIASIFKAVAYSPDGLIEAIELIDNSTHPFLFGVQFHPERVGEDNKLSNGIGNEFLQQITFFQKSMSH